MADMNKIDRRNFLYNMLMTAASWIPFSVTNLGGEKNSKTIASPPGLERPPDSVPEIIDTNVNLFQWPFRKLKYDETELLIAKLRKHRISKAWTGSFEALFHKNIDSVNSRLARECRAHGEGILVPFGTVNLAWPDWEEELRRCHEVHDMPGIRIYPGYQPFDLNHPDFVQFVQEVTDRGMILQIACDMEDARVHHPVIEVRDAGIELLPDTLRRVPEAKVQLLYWNHEVGSALLEELIRKTNAVFDITRIEHVGGVGRLIDGNSWFGNMGKLPVERFMFGSYAPYFPVEANLLKLFESPLTEKQSIAIMNGNARRFISDRS